MAKRLILIRHAKSSWDDFSLPDHDRPLNKRGHKAAAALAGWLSEKGYAADEAFVSTASRTRETYEGLKTSAVLHLIEALYHADPDTIMQTLQKARGETVTLIGHNPGIGHFASRIVTTPPSHPRFTDYPTGATLVADLPITSWDEVRFGTGEVVDFVVPRDLTD